MSIVEFENVSFIFGNHPKILNGASFSLEAGSLTFVTGANGSGKTALLNLMSARCALWTGKICLLGRELVTGERTQLANLRSKIGVVLEGLRLLDNLSPRENLALPLHIDGACGQELDVPISELLGWLGPRVKATEFVESLSMGEKQLLAIARALVRSPRLVVADEPTAHLNFKQKIYVLDFFSKLCRLGTTVVIATNDDHLISQYSYDSQLYLEDGSLHQIAGRGPLPFSALHDLEKT